MCEFKNAERSECPSVVVCTLHSVSCTVDRMQRSTMEAGEEALEGGGDELIWYVAVVERYDSVCVLL